MHDKKENAAKTPTPNNLARRGVRFEALVMVAFWLTMAVWVLGVCYQFGYASDPAEAPVVLGMPAWVAWGVFGPWCFSTLFTIWFALFKMSDDEPNEGGPGPHSSDRSQTLGCRSEKMLAPCEHQLELDSNDLDDNLDG